MIINEELYNQFESYMNGSLKESDKIQFEKNLLKNDFKVAFDDYKVSQKLLILSELSNVNSTFEDIKSKKRNAQKRTKIFIGLGVAASILTAVIWLAPSPKTSDQLSAQKDVESPIKTTLNTNSEHVDEEVSSESNLTEPTHPVESNITLINPTKSLNNTESVIPTTSLSEEENIEPSNETVTINETESEESLSNTSLNERITPTTNEIVDNCSDWSINVSPSIACYGKANGVITISSNQSITAKAFRYEDEIGTYNGNIEDLEHGVYSLDITSDAGCTKSFEEVEISNVVCLEETYYLDMQMNPTLQINLPQEFLGTYQIIDASGISIKNGSVTDQQISWNGLNTNGERVTTGIYILLLTEGNHTMRSKISVR